MALATYFDKAALSAATLLRGVGHNHFAGLLGECAPEVVFDAAAAECRDTRWTLELVVNLCARLYPRLGVRVAGPQDASTQRLEAHLRDVAFGCNPLITLSDASRTAGQFALVVGATRIQGPAAYLGSSGWIAKVSNGPVNTPDTGNPFGSGAAACLGAAALFRRFFGAYIDGTDLTSTLDPIAIDLRNMALADIDADDLDRLPAVVDIGQAFLVGVGAVGNGAAWALSRTEGLSGTLYVIDHELFELSNLQRYVLATDRDIGTSKVERCAREFAGHAGLRVAPQRVKWAEFVANHRGLVLDRVLIALDSAKDRIGVQASLPRWIVNAWTQPANLGVSRHPDFLTDACVACLYLPGGTAKSEDQLYADALGAVSPPEVLEIRTRLYDGAPVGSAFIQRVADRLSVPASELERFSERPIRAFYTEAICGGLVLKLSSAGPRSEVDVPMAFQSALAGVLLAAEIVADVVGARAASLPCRTELNLLRSIGSSLNVPNAKHPSGRCICQDALFRAAFARKYNRAG